MKVLWFEISQPSKYEDTGFVYCGWQDSLERIVRSCNEIELTIAFQTDKGLLPKIVDGVKYKPLVVKKNWLTKKKCQFSWKYDIEALIPLMKEAISDVKPDIIHVFGNEWPFGLIAQYTKIPVVIHIQGAIIPYLNAIYPPSYSDLAVLYNLFPEVKAMLYVIKNHIKMKSRANMESTIWKVVENYMGRTTWDFALSHVQHPSCNYYHVEEALRPAFLDANKKWHGLNNKELVLLSIGKTSFWKGADMLLKTAHVLKGIGIPFKWFVAGEAEIHTIKIIEKQESLKFSDNNITVLGNVEQHKLADLLCSCSMLVHTAYIENSPNAICEAQSLGVPIVSTNVGGISSLIRDGVDGILVPANDPWQMAFNIVTLSKDLNRLKKMSESTKTFAMNRHNPENILKQLLSCYKDIIKKKENRINNSFN